MKGKGLDAVKGLALRHGEKLVMTLVVLCAAWLVYGTMSHQSLPAEKTSEQLRSKAKQVNDTVNNYKWDDATQNVPGEVRVFEPVKSVASIEIPSPPYDPVTGYDNPVAPLLELRKDPTLLAATGFEVHAVTGLYAFLDAETARLKANEQERLAQQTAAEQALAQEEARRAEERRAASGNRPGATEPGFEDINANPNRRPVATALPKAGVDVTELDLIRQLSCAVVMAKVPLPEQLQEYKKALSNNRFYQPSEDYPKYIGYQVERAEVVGDGELKWTKLNFPNGHFNIEGDTARSLPAITSDPNLDFINRMTANWQVGMEDVFDPRYGHESLVVPLAPLVGRNWGEMAYLSEVPLAVDVEREMMNQQPTDTAAPAPAEGEGEGEDIFGADAFSGVNRGGGGGGEMAGRGRPRSGGFSGGRGMRGDEGDMGSRGGGMRGPGAQFDVNGEMIVDVPFLMLRFFDLTVQPGKRYKYRVQLILSDPNYQKPREQLDQTVSNRTRKPVIFTDWSEPSMTIAVPQAGIVRVAESKSPRTGYYTEPEATMLVESFSVDERGNAMQGSIELPATRRGAVMNYLGTVEVLVEQGRFIDKIDNFAIDTGVVVLDLSGGRTTDGFSREKPEPTHALLMDATGRMYLRDELDDEIDVAIHRAVFAETEAGDAGGGFERGRGGFGSGMFDE